MLCLVVVFRVDAIRAAKFFRDLEFARVDVDSDDAGSLCLDCAHDDSESNSAKSPDGDC